MPPPPPQKLNVFFHMFQKNADSYALLKRVRPQAFRLRIRDAGRTFVAVPPILHR